LISVIKTLDEPLYVESPSMMNRSKKTSFLTNKYYQIQ